jgi:poly-gamma-glutamate capsule biosynthesis protein CapA/YwtB (metallophosphatase superfamily)
VGEHAERERAHLMAFEFLFTGDLVLDEPDPDYWLSGIAPALRRADLAIGHLEVPHTRRGAELAGDVPAPGAEPAHLAALRRAGIDAVSLAGNHMADCGAEGIADTIAELGRLGIAHSGAGANLTLARAPAALPLADRSIGLLSYNCVGPESSWATHERAGCAYVRIRTRDGSPIAPAAPLDQADEHSLAEMARDIRAARQAHDLLIVALHKGIVHTPATLAPYERAVAHAAIEAGADVVIGHHAHIARGIEFHQGKPIFHGLGNGCVVTRALSPAQSHPTRAAWAERRKRLFGFEPDPRYELAPFHPEAVQALIGCITLGSGGVERVGFIPVFVEPPGRPVLAEAAMGEQIAGYIARITEQAGLPPLQLTTRPDMIEVAA